MHEIAVGRFGFKSQHTFFWNRLTILKKNQGIRALKANTVKPAHMAASIS